MGTSLYFLCRVRFSCKQEGYSQRAMKVLQQCRLRADRAVHVQSKADHSDWSSACQALSDSMHGQIYTRLSQQQARRLEGFPHKAMGKARMSAGTLTWHMAQVVHQNMMQQSLRKRTQPF